jgi:hypothetical protein
VADRPYEKVSTNTLRFLLGVGQEGIEVWSKNSHDYRTCERELVAVERELKIRERGTRNDVQKPQDWPMGHSTS